jgi:hypothetical protein
MKTKKKIIRTKRNYEQRYRVTLSSLVLVFVESWPDYFLGLCLFSTGESNFFFANHLCSARLNAFTKLSILKATPNNQVCLARKFNRRARKTKEALRPEGEESLPADAAGKLRNTKNKSATRLQRKTHLRGTGQRTPQVGQRSTRFIAEE